MTKATLLKTVPPTIRGFIRYFKVAPSKALLREHGYKIVTNGVFKWVAIHDSHVLKFSRTPKENCVVDREVRMYNSLTTLQRRLVVPMFSVAPSISIACRVLTDDPAKREVTAMDSVASGLRMAWATMGIIWTDDHGENIGFMHNRSYPVVIDLDFLESK